MAVSPRSSKVGFALGTSGSWGTGTAFATAVGIGSGVWVTDDLKISLSMQVDEDDSAGQGFITSMQVANHNAIKAAIPTFLHYNHTFQNVFWLAACGTGGTNTFEPATNKTGVYGTIVRDKVQFISEANGKCTGFDLTFGENGRGEVTWMFLCDKEKVDSTTNTATQVSALTFPTQGLRAFMKQAVFRVNLASGGALGAGDAVKISNLSLKYSQPLDSIFVLGQDSIIEPEDDKYPDIEIDATFARFDSASDDYIGYHRDNTNLKADLTFTSGTSSILFQFPRLIVRAAPVEFKGAASNVHPKVTFGAYKASSAPTGMTGITAPFRITTA